MNKQVRAIELAMERSEIGRSPQTVRFSNYAVLDLAVSKVASQFDITWGDTYAILTSKTGGMVYVEVGHEV